jgi:exonuclease V gamma subunit
MSAGLTLHFAEDLESLLDPLSTFLFAPSAEPLVPLWSVVPNLSLRQWLDQELSRRTRSVHGGVTANLLSIFPKDLAVRLERLVLEDRWRDWGIEATAMRIMAALQLSSYDDARRRAEAIDEIVRWRPHLLDPAHLADVPERASEAIEALDLVHQGPQVQRAEVLERLRVGRVDGLPDRMAVFGLPEVSAGPRFLELLSALSVHVEVACFLPVPSIDLARRVLEGSDPFEDPQLPFGWLRDAVEALRQWATLDAAHELHEPGSPRGSSSLARLQDRLVDGVASPGPPDGSVRLLGGFGDARQVEQVRDAIFDVLATGVEPHQILVVSPEPSAFAAALERHWNYQPADEDGGPRLAFELIDVAPDRLRNRLGASLELLRLIGGYATVEQVVSFLAHPAVAATLKIDFDESQQLARRAEEAKLIFGISPEQRRRFDVYPTDDSTGFPADMGTWERVTDAVAVATLYPARGEEGSTAPGPLEPAGEPADLSTFARIQPLLRLLESADALRTAPGIDASAERRPLRAWLAQLGEWMSTVAAFDGEDDSYEAVVRRLERSLEGDADLEDLLLDLDQVLELWSSLAQARRYSRVFGRRGVVVAGLEALAYAPFEAVVILGLDEEKLPTAALASPVMLSAPPSTSPGARPPGDPDRRRHVLGGLLAAVLSARRQLVVSWNVSDEGTGGPVDPPIALSELLDALAEVDGPSAAEVLEAQYQRARRHNFAGEHTERRYDTRLWRVDPVPLERRATEPIEQPERVGIDELQSFFRDPVGRHLRHAENVSVPESLDEASIRPAIEVDHLTLHSLRQAFVEEVMALSEWRAIAGSVRDEDSYLAARGDLDRAAAPLFDRLVHDEAFAGDVPSIFWLDAKLRDQLVAFCFNLAFELADFEPVTDALAPELAEIDLGDQGRLVLLSPHGARQARFVPLRSVDDARLVATHHWRPTSKGGKEKERRNLALRLVELLALRVNRPEAECRVITAFAPDNPGPSKKKQVTVPSGAFALNPAFELRATPESLPAEQARAQLTTLVRLYREGLDVVLPLFRESSAALAFVGLAGDPDVAVKQSRSSWEDSYGREAESDHVTSQLLFPLTFDELVAETEFRDVARRLGEAARGVEFCWDTMGRRRAPTSLRRAHAGFAALHDEVQTKIRSLDDDGGEQADPGAREAARSRLGQVFLPATEDQ